jgi:hypothetical protein
MNAIEVGLSLVLAVHVAGLRAVSAGGCNHFLENPGKKFQFLSKGILITKSFGSVDQGSQD